MSADDSDFIWKDLLAAVYWFDESLQLYLKSAGWPQMSRTKSLIMLNISEGWERSNQIAENLGLTRQAVHLAIKELQAEGLVSIEVDPQDRRAKRVFFAAGDQSEQMRKEARQALMQIEAHLAATVGADEFATFRNVLRRDWGEPLRPSAQPPAPSLTQPPTQNG